MRDAAVTLYRDANTAGKPVTLSDFAADVREGLTTSGQKRLSPKYLYDALGSSLFEAITQVPEYGLWRAERILLTRHAEEIARLAAPHNVVELGSGSASKTAQLLKALLRQHPLSYWTIDLSATAIAMTQRELAGLQGLRVHTIESDYLAGLDAALHGRPANERTLVLFLGSSLGNFDNLSSSLFVQRIRRALRPGDALLLGADLEKPQERLLAAYDDALGVTAAFNLNLLVRMNRELRANFVLPQFVHVARFNAATCDVEMHIESRLEQTIEFVDFGFSVRFRSGETIHTESSHKYSIAELNRIVEKSGFRLTSQWLNSEWQFASCLYAAV